MTSLAELEKKWGKLDFIVHAIAYSDKEELKGRYVDTSLENFKNTDFRPNQVVLGMSLKLN